MAARSSFIQSSRFLGVLMPLLNMFFAASFSAHKAATTATFYTRVACSSRRSKRFAFQTNWHRQSQINSRTRHIFLPQLFKLYSSQNNDNSDGNDNYNDSDSSSTVATKPQSIANSYLMQTRLSIASAKKQTRREYLEQDRQRNLRLKRLLHSDASNSNSTMFSDSGYEIPKMYAIRVSVDKELREELKMNGREKRGRVFIEMGGEGCKSIKGLKYELHAFFRCLKKSSFVLSGGLPEVLEDGSILSPGDEANNNSQFTYDDFWPIKNDEDVLRTFAEANKFYNNHNGNLKDDKDDSTLDLRRLKRPSILIHVRKDPNVPPPPPPPPYLNNMANPKETESMTMLSFYSFPPDGIGDAEEFSFFLRKVWIPFDALGRVYVATEGVNAQMSIPTNVLQNFMECCKSIPELGVHMENGINIDPKTLTMAEFAIAGDMDGKPAPPFKNLHIRARNQIVADGLDKPLNWEKAGYDMPPLEWHKKLKEAREKRQSKNDDDIPLIFDCRNKYETTVGRFEGAEPLDTENFRDSWDILKDKLKDKPKDVPIMTYCTGGIRCVKVGAYLTQELGFTNVSRLAGGIIAYDRTLNEEAKDEEPMFKGTNYVFDGRVGRQITNDALGECITCGKKTFLISNCSNDNCHKRMVQCEICRDNFLGTCSDACKTRVINSAMKPRRKGESFKPHGNGLQSGTKYNSLDDYSSGHSSPPPSLYNEIELNTSHYLATGAHMVSGASQGRLLKSLASMTREGRILELGTFTGYATACFLEGAADAGNVIGNDDVPGSREGGPFVMSLERDSRAIDLAVSHLNIMSRYGIGEKAAEEACKIRSEGVIVDAVESNSISFSYQNAGCEIVRVTDALATMEAIAYGNASNDCGETTAPFDIVFIDADKTRLLDYVEACVSSDKVLKRGGLIVVDNVLWKGLVLDISGGGMSQAAINESEVGMTDKELKKSRRSRRLANIMHEFNKAIAQDNRIEVVVLPMRDGLSIIRKK